MGQHVGKEGGGKGFCELDAAVMHIASSDMDMATRGGWCWCLCSDPCPAPRSVGV